MKNPLTGQCYVISEALYYMLGGKAAGWKPMVMKTEEGTHWFLEHKSGAILDATSSQFTSRRNERHDCFYDGARGCGFLTKKPSKRTQALIRRLNAASRQ